MKKLKHLLIFMGCLLLLFFLSYKNYDVAQKAHIDSISVSSYTNNEKISSKELFRETWLLTKSTYWDPKLNEQNWYRWKRRYIDEIETDEDAYLAINTMLASLDDPYSKFLSTKEFSDQNTIIDSKIYGIGINIISLSGKTYIANVIKGTPADAVGLKQGDMIVAIDGNNVSGKSVFQTAQYIKGDLGAFVSLELVREGKKLTKKVKRGEIKVKTVEYSSLNKDIGYIRILSFISHDTPLEFVTALDSLKDKRALVLDLRGNTGGLFQNAIFVTNLFLRKGRIVSVIGRGGDSVVYNVNRDAYVYDKPLVVLVDGESASASEIVSGALKDHKRAKIVGTRTFGKGLVQKIYAMPNETGMNLTIARYLTPNGEDIHGRGIEPNFNVVLSENDYLKNDDRQLKFAKSLVEKELKSFEEIAKR